MQFQSVDSKTEEALIAKCQQNGWLMRGGYDWQDDPYLEEYPYTFSIADSIEDLRGFFQHGNWSIRQGIVYKDLAFIQQVDGGDEWWTLKQVEDGWTSFESISFEGIAKDPLRFRHMICSMVASSPELCRKLDYLAPKEIIDKLIALADEYDFYGVQDSHPDPEDFRTYVVRSFFETPDAVVDWLRTIGEEADDKAVLSLADELSSSAGKRNRQEEPLSDKADRARKAEPQQQRQTATHREVRDK